MTNQSMTGHEAGAATGRFTPALDALVERVRIECSTVLDKTISMNAHKALWRFFHESVTDEEVGGVLAELYRVTSMPGYVPVEVQEDPSLMFPFAEGPGDYLQGLLVVVVMTRITRPDLHGELDDDYVSPVWLTAHPEMSE